MTLCTLTAVIYRWTACGT